MKRFRPLLDEVKNDLKRFDVPKWQLSPGISPEEILERQNKPNRIELERLGLFLEARQGVDKKNDKIFRDFNNKYLEGRHKKK
ncbi:hypothetical protein AGMMS49921_02370 [Endomicrobiia bacterium]|nr:hypothetical protein AGMMS49921_02370 [Endomicrobiia bacterium]